MQNQGEKLQNIPHLFLTIKFRYMFFFLHMPHSSPMDFLIFEKKNQNQKEFVVPIQQHFE